MKSNKNINIYKAMVKMVEDVSGETMSMKEAEHDYMDLVEEERAMEIYLLHKQGYLEI